MVLDPNKPLDELVKTTAVGRGRGRGGRAAARGGRGGAGPAANGGAASTGRGRGAARGRGRGRGAAAPTGRGAAKAGGARAAAAPVKAAPKLTVTVLNNRAARPAGLGPRQQQLAAIGAAAGIGAVRGAQAAVRPSAAVPRVRGDLRATLATGHLTDASVQSSKKALTTGTKMIITNLDSGVTVEDIRELFGEKGPLKSAKMVAVGVAEVVFQRRLDALKAHKDYNHVKLDGRPMYIQVEDEPQVAAPPARVPASRRAGVAA